jgi:uncharacterized protein YneF (UPF0154 family)
VSTKLAIVLLAFAPLAIVAGGLWVGARWLKRHTQRPQEWI